MNRTFFEGFWGSKLVTLPAALALALSLPLAGCGGKKALTFTGAPHTGGSSNGGTDGMGEAGSGTNPVTGSCGDRVVNGDEECDDGARADGDGCDGSCVVETGWTCTGEPSACVKCGNGKLEEGEECDDGNSDAGDGCSPECKIEGSCAAPSVITLKPGKDGLTGTISATTSASDTGQVEAGVCGAGEAGAGADRIFQFELQSAADLEVTVGSNFDAIARITTKACDLTTELPGSCADAAAVAGQETITLNDAKAGTYFVVVDGKTAKQAGDFSVDVVARCPLSGVKIDRVILQEPFRTLLLNTNQSCSVELSRLGIYAQPEASDAPATLPAAVVQPLKRVALTSESPPPNGAIYQGALKFDTQGYAGAYYLCRGECDSIGGTNVIDAFRWKGTGGALTVKPPKAVKFTADPAALADRLTMSYWRFTTDNVAPAFSGNDFTGAYFAETFEDSSMLGWEMPPPLFYKTTFEKIMGTVGAFSMTLEGGNPDDNTWNGTRHTFKDNTGTEIRIAPTDISVRLHGTDKAANHGWAFFGNTIAQAKGVGSFFRENGTLGFGAPTTAFSISYLANTWYTIDYQITYDQTGGNAIVYIDGKTQPTWKMAFPSQTISEINLRSLTNDSSFSIDQIVVR